MEEGHYELLFGIASTRDDSEYCGGGDEPEYGLMYTFDRSDSS